MGKPTGTLTALRLLVMVVLATSAVVKLWSFGEAAAKYGVALTAIAIAFEGIVAISLCLRHLTRAAGAGVFLLGVAFLTQTVPRAVSGAASGSCSCFGSLLAMSARQAVLLDCMLVISGALLYRSDHFRQSDGRLQAQPLSSLQPATITRAVGWSLAWLALMACLYRIGLASDQHQGRGPQPSPALAAEVGAGLPEVTVRTTDGAVRSLHPSDGRWWLLLLLTRRCRACTRLAQDVAAVVERWPPWLAVAVVARESPERWVQQIGPRIDVFTDPAGVAWRLVAGETAAAPAYVLVSPDGVVRHAGSKYLPGRNGLVADLEAWLADAPSGAAAGPLPPLWIGRLAVDCPVFADRPDRLLAPDQTAPVILCWATLVASPPPGP
ncbi:MAG: hypothetical protein IT204_08980 [Fimbriimonadaceae bacterium]|nr:hypothetical protein [Fimbriimonadaceae bacterium]